MTSDNGHVADAPCGNPHPEGRSNWLEHGLIEKAMARFDLPITHLVSSYGLVAECALA
jgi:hypothetical protein